ncbi:hypothetical protein CDAR_573941 [Caerostris darwini]|uniref:Uncharacterized protein n=1 Tax=Caerostris darwini TaxID=1538125 RepID=A0AAV4T7P1_9ARAC|nr:hypothetical protein CDAR_573941 [Caerostris darwini]
MTPENSFRMLSTKPGETKMDMCDNSELRKETGDDISCPGKLSTDLLPQMRGIAEEYFDNCGPLSAIQNGSQKKNEDPRYDGKIFRSNFRGGKFGHATP